MRAGYFTLAREKPDARRSTTEMKIEKTQQSDTRSRRAQRLFFFFTPSALVLPTLYLVVILAAEAYYRFKLYPKLGLENCLGPAGFGAIVLAVALVLKARSDRQSQSAVRKRQGVSTRQSVTIHDRGVEISQGSLMNTCYAWRAVDNVIIRGKYLIFSLSGGDLFIRRAGFTQEEINQIMSFWKKRDWSNKGVQSDEERPAPPPLPRA